MARRVALAMVSPKSTAPESAWSMSAWRMVHSKAA